MSTTHRLVSKILTLACVLLAASPMVFAENPAATNKQEIIPLDSPAYAAIDSLYLEEGLVLPSAARPYSAAEFEMALSRIHRSSLSSAGERSYEIVAGVIHHRSLYTEPGGFAFNTTPTLTVAGFVATDPSAVAKGATNRFWERRPSLVNLPLEIWMGHLFYADFELPIKVDPFLQNPGVVPAAKESNVTNIPLSTAQVDFMLPLRAFLDLGGAHWNVQFGRDTLSWDDGSFGNLALSDNSLFYDFLRFTTYWNVWKLTSLVIDLPPYYPGQGTLLLPLPPGASGENTLSLSKTLLAHRLEFRIYNRATLALNEMLMIGGKVPTLGEYNPLDIFHNWFIWEVAKSFASAELTVSPYRWFNLFGQFAVDQIQTPLKKDLYNTQSIPSAYGYLAGVRAIYPVAGGYLHLDGQFTRTDPWTYLAGSAGGAPEPWLNYYSRQRVVSNVLEAAGFLENPIGWWDGPDSQAFDASLSYTRPGSYSIKGEVDFVQHGVNTMDTTYRIGSTAAQMTTPGTNPINTLTLHLHADYSPLPYLTVGADAYYVTVANVGHAVGQTASNLLAKAYVQVKF